MKRLSIYVVCLFWMSSSCQNQVAIEDINVIPVTSIKDQKYADVFSILDGVWKGQFLIFEDQKRVPKNEIDLKNIASTSLQKEGLQQVNSINVEQIYTSENPFFQRVTITDSYPDTGQKIVSKGVNKIQEGRMWCVVQKPDEMVIHKGNTEGENTIIWWRNEKSPQRIEYFKETVSKDFYEIIGWGYYQGDDTKLSPKLWFYAKYERQNKD
ncbi:hypothetical protein [Aquimarina sp. 2304DJ70-9]|uniref:hypothetical protein n=1 Tax=Aquimarina penaris TaxID=3231044 RepID=UPI003462411B